MSDQFNQGDGYPPGMPPGEDGAHGYDESAQPQWPAPDVPPPPGYGGDLQSTVALPEGGYGDPIPPPPGMEQAPPAPAFDAPEVVAAGGPAEVQEQPKKKRKIDLKERLSSVRAAGTMAGVAPKPSDSAAFPPPPRGSVPPPRVMSTDGIAPPPAIAALMGVGKEEKEAPKPTAAQQTIKVEMGDEVLAERRKMRKRSILYAAISFVVALIAGFAVGGVKARGDMSREAVAGASDLAKQVEESNKIMLDLSDALRGAVDELKNEKFPTSLADTLKGINVPFSANTLSGKQISGLTGTVLRDLLNYSRGVEDLNKTKDKLRNLLGVTQKPVEEYNAEKKAPVFKFAVVFAPSNAGMVAELAPIKKPFKVGEKSWPDTIPVLRLVNDKPTDVEAERWKKGDLTGAKPQAIPIEPKTVAGFTGQKIILELRSTLAETAALVDGNQSPIPAEQTDGLLKEGERLSEELKKIARK